MTLDKPPSAFLLYHWKNPETTCDYPFLAVSEDRSALLAFGNRGLSFEWDLPDEAADWLAQDFECTGESLHCELSTLRYLFDQVFAGGIAFGLMAFDAELAPSWLGLSLTLQKEADEGPEYLIEGLGQYRRVHRAAGRLGPVTLPERAVLDVCVASFGELASVHREKFSELPPPRYRLATEDGVSEASEEEAGKDQAREK